MTTGITYKNYIIKKKQWNCMSSDNIKCQKKYVYPLFSDPNSVLTFKWNLGLFWYLSGTGVFLFANLLIAKGDVLFMFLFFQANLCLVEHPLNWNIPFRFTPPTLFLSVLVLWRNHGLVENLRVINGNTGPGDEIHRGLVLAINRGFIEDVWRWKHIVSCFFPS